MKVLTPHDLQCILHQDGFYTPSVLRDSSCKWRVALCAPGSVPLQSRRVFVQCCSLRGGRHAVPTHLAGEILHVLIEPDSYRRHYSICSQLYHYKTPATWQCSWHEEALKLYVHVLSDLQVAGAQTSSLVVMGESAGVMSATVLVAQLMSAKYTGIAVKSCFLFSGAFNPHAGQFFKHAYDGHVVVHVVNHEQDQLCLWSEQSGHWRSLECSNVRILLLTQESRVMYGATYHNSSGFVLSLPAFWDVVRGDASAMSLDVPSTWRYDSLLQTPSFHDYSLLWGVRLIAAAWFNLWLPRMDSEEWHGTLDCYLGQYNDQQLFWKFSTAPPHVQIVQDFLPHFKDALHEGLTDILRTSALDATDNQFSVAVLSQEDSDAEISVYCMVRFSYCSTRKKYHAFRIWKGSELQSPEQGVFHPGSIVVVHCVDKSVLTGVLIDVCSKPTQKGVRSPNSVAYVDLIMSGLPGVDAVRIDYLELVPMPGLMGLSSWFDTYVRDQETFAAFLSSGVRGMPKPKVDLSEALLAASSLRASQGPAKVIETINKMQNSSMVCVTGPPGCGKTTHIVAVVQSLLRPLLPANNMHGEARCPFGHKSSQHLLLCASTNQAVAVLAGAMDELLSDSFFKAVPCYLIASERKYGSMQQLYKNIHVVKFSPKITLELQPVHIVLATVGLLQRPPKKCYRDPTQFLRGQFDYLISDEAGQTADMNNFALLTYLRASARILYVGDVKQLTCFSGLRLRRRSVLAAASRLAQEQERVILGECFRFGSYLGAIHCQLFYKDEGLKAAVPGSACNVAFVEIEADSDSADVRSSPVSADVEACLLKLLEKGWPGLCSVAYISYYGAQKRLVRSGVGASLSTRSVDESQGYEADIVVLGIGRVHGVGFLNMLERLNVSLSRAKKLLVIVAHRSFMSQRRLPSAVFGVYKEVAQLIQSYILLSSKDDVRAKLQTLVARVTVAQEPIEEAADLVVSRVLNSHTEVCQQVSDYFRSLAVGKEAEEDLAEIASVSNATLWTKSSIPERLDASLPPALSERASVRSEVCIPQGWAFVKVRGCDALLQKFGKENDVFTDFSTLRRLVHDVLLHFLGCAQLDLARSFFRASDADAIGEQRLHFMIGLRGSEKRKTASDEPRRYRHVVTRESELLYCN